MADADHEGLASMVAPYNGLLAMIGGVTLSVITLRVLAAIWDGLKTFFLAGPLGLGTNPKKMGQWAVVTGATDGIGKEFAIQLAKMGMDVVLISRTQEKLEQVAKEIEGASNVKTKIIAVDFTDGHEIFGKIETELAGLEIGVLVNNVGVGYSYPEYYTEIDVKVVRDMLRTNCNSVAEMTHLLLPGMAKRGKGMIINIGSASGFTPMPLLSLYSATKMFVDCLSRALQIEYESKGIVIQSVMPFFVTSKLSKIRKPNLLVPSPADFVKSALATVGLKPQTTGYAAHGLQKYLADLVPMRFRDVLLFWDMNKTRKRALKKAAQKKE